MKFALHKITPAIFLFAVLFNSCKNDLKLNAPYKEMPSIYAVINPQEKIQVIRVNRVFLSETDANQTAKIADSINYAAGDLTITLDRYEGSNHVDACPTCPEGHPDKKTITFHDSMVVADAGAFNTQQRVYVSNASLRLGLPVIDSHGLNTNPNWKVAGDYVLTVKNNKTGNVFTSKTTSIDSISGNQGLDPFSPPFYPYAAGTAPSTPPYMDYSVQNANYSVYYSPKTTSGTVYQVNIRLHFYDLLYNGNKDFKYVDYTLSNQYPKDTRRFGGQNFLVAEFKGKDLFNAVGVSLSRLGLSDQVQGRKMYKIQYFVFSSSNDYIDYLQFTAPSLNISQSKPLYSNFDNRAALGIFTFRARCSVTKEMATNFVSEFQANPATCNYLFYNADESRKGCN